MQTAGEVPSSPTQSNGTVLVVEDSATIRALIVAILSPHGYRVATACCATEALARLDELQPDVMITDVEMPGMNGIGLCRRVLDMSRQPVHVIILSKHTDRVVDGLDAGAADYVGKPFVAAELLARVRSGMRIVDRQKEMLSDAHLLRRSFDSVSADRARMGRDLDAAAELQSGLLPPTVSHCNSLTISCAVQPESVLSGDTVGILQRTPERVAIYAADVAGSGTAAALLATAIAHELRSLTSSEVSDGGKATSAREIVAVLNRNFVDFARSERYSTMALAMIDSGRRQAEVCVAGHPRPALIGADGSLRFIGEGGFPVGLLEQAEYGSIDVAFEPGDRIVLFSDGFIEARLPGGAMLGYQGMSEMLRAIAGLPVDNLAPVLVERLGARLGRSVHDDVSVIAAGYRTP
jgi:sigma-B regulation protein RsbU (phosphoserine phosphatase)